MSFFDMFCPDEVFFLLLRCGHIRRQLNLRLAPAFSSISGSRMCSPDVGGCRQVGFTAEFAYAERTIGELAVRMATATSEDPRGAIQAPQGRFWVLSSELSDEEDDVASPPAGGGCVKLSAGAGSPEEMAFDAMDAGYSPRTAMDIAFQMRKGVFPRRRQVAPEGRRPWRRPLPRPRISPPVTLADVGWTVVSKRRLKGPRKVAVEALNGRKGGSAAVGDCVSPSSARSALVLVQFDGPPKPMLPRGRRAQLASCAQHDVRVYPAAQRLGLLNPFVSGRVSMDLASGGAASDGGHAASDGGLAAGDAPSGIAPAATTVPAASAGMIGQAAHGAPLGGAGTAAGTWSGGATAAGTRAPRGWAAFGGGTAGYHGGNGGGFRGGYGGGYGNNYGGYGGDYGNGYGGGYGGCGYGNGYGGGRNYRFAPSRGRFPYQGRGGGRRWGRGFRGTNEQ